MNKKLFIFYISILSISGAIAYLINRPKEILYEAKWNDINTLAITIDGVISTTFPTTNAYEGTVSCTTGTGSVSWNGSKWVLTTSGITKGKTKCNIIFNKPLYKAILAKNTVKQPLTTPGTEVSAYKESDVTATSSSSVSSTYRSYYVTYGTGYEANGTEFNLTGTAVTTDTYTNSYASLVGKYLPYDRIYDSGSSTAGTKVTTTNLNYVVYVVSATSSKFTYKLIGSNKNQSEALLASTDDDYGTSYYFRGSVTNNYVKFANKCWRIVRIGGDNTIKLILHNDNTANVSNPCSSENNSTNAAFARYSGSTYTSTFNSSNDDNAYVGFMYGTPGSTTYEATHANINKSTALTNLEIWYNNNLKTYESVIDDNVFCNDKSVFSGLGYGTNKTSYIANKRAIIKEPSLKCNGDLSRIIGKVGLITSDETIYAGYNNIGYSYNYLQENANGSDWWTMSPAVYLDNTAGATIYKITGSSGRHTYLKVDGSGTALRPYISLKATANISGGTGTSEDPYVVE